MNVLVHNLLEYVKLRALPAEMRSLKPKALRFRLFNVAGRLTGHGRRVWLHLSAALPATKILIDARAALSVKTASTPAPA